ncbi:MAG: DUF2851 family protein [Chloroflexi bacterium]|nr:DUF2851 family protein [Chloroflexota bacterium]
MTDRDGKTYQVMYSGRPAPGGGPDFVDAVVTDPDGVVHRGDIEIHVRRSGWYSHGHDRDPGYNGVIFHVTGSEEGDEVQASSGVRIPFLLLKPGAMRGGHPVRPSAEIPKLTLDEAGDRRFFARSAGLELDLARAEGDQVLWAEVLECLGYSKNRKPFRQLSARVPWSMLQTRFKNGPPSEVALLLRQGAGFDIQDGDSGTRIIGAVPEWSKASGRPDNSPKNRIEGAAALAHRWLGSRGPVDCMFELIGGDTTPDDLIAALMVQGVGDRRALIGKSRAVDIAINAVLPTVHAVSRRAGHWHVYERSISLYREFPKSSENSITREMRRVVGLKKRVEGGRQQQGLIYRSMTRSGIAERWDGSGMSAYLS